MDEMMRWASSNAASNSVAWPGRICRLAISRIMLCGLRKEDGRNQADGNWQGHQSWDEPAFGFEVLVDTHGIERPTFDVRGGPLAGRPLDGGVRPLSKWAQVRLSACLHRAFRRRTDPCQKLLPQPL